MAERGDVSEGGTSRVVQDHRLRLPLRCDDAGDDKLDRQRPLGGAWSDAAREALGGREEGPVMGGDDVQCLSTKYLRIMGLRAPGNAEAVLEEGICDCQLVQEALAE